MTKKLWVAGCSYSNRTGVYHSWGDYLAEHLGCEYQHLAHGCSSNHYGWRRIMLNIIQGNITSDDQVIWQITEIARTELPSAGISWDQEQHDLSMNDLEYRKNHGVTPHSINRTDNPEHTYWTSHWKSGSWEWQTHDLDQDLHRAYENNIAGDYYNWDRLACQMQGLRAIARERNINLTIFWSRYVSRNHAEELSQLLGLNTTQDVWEVPDVINSEAQRSGEFDLGYEQSADFWDNSHLNEQGHRHVAEFFKKRFSD